MSHEGDITDRIYDTCELVIIQTLVVYYNFALVLKIMIIDWNFKGFLISYFHEGWELYKKKENKGTKYYQNFLILLPILATNFVTG